tara:strand:+ start:203 stop:1927 length:1725 start_codon:yes stop_codon:yes gene_type:complete
MRLNKTTIILLCTSLLFGKSYTIDNVNIESTIGGDGIVQITEKRTFNFRGRFSYAYQKIDKKLFKEIYDIQLSENGHKYINNSSSEPYTFTVTSNKKSIKIKWFHESEDISKEFVVSYKLRGALRIGPDDAQFQWTYLGDKWNKKTKQFSVEQRFERELPAGDIWYSATGISQKKIDVDYDGLVLTLDTRSVGKNASIRINTIFPSTYLYSPVINDQGFTKINELDNINKRVQKRSTTGYLALLFSIGSMILFGFRFSQYGKPHPVKKSSENGNNFNFPSNHHPALISFFYSGHKVTGHAILASLIGLSSKGYYTIKDIEKTKKSFFRKKEKTKKYIEVIRIEKPVENKLHQLDQLLLNRINKCLGKGKNTLENIFKEIGEDFGFMKSLKKVIDKDIDNNQWVEKPSSKSTKIYFFLHVIMILVMIFLFTANILAGILSIIFLLFMGLFGSFGIMRLSVEAKSYRHYWREFSAQLQKEGLPKNHDLDMNEILQYAIVIGCDKKVKGLLKGFTPIGDDHAFYWYHGVGDGNLNMDSFTSSFAGMIDTGTAVSAGFGGDGGAGDGGAGGGGGGGAG